MFDAFSFSITAFCWFCSWVYCSSVLSSSSSSSCSDDDSLTSSSLPSHACSYIVTTCSIITSSFFISPHQTCPSHDSHKNWFLLVSFYQCSLFLISPFPVYSLNPYFWLGAVTTWKRHKCSNAWVHQKVQSNKLICATPSVKEWQDCMLMPFIACM